MNTSCTTNLNLFQLQTQEITCSTSQLKVSPVVLYQRLGHPSQQTLALIIKNTKMNLSANIPACVACVVGKSWKLPFSDSQTIYTSPL